MANFDVLSGRLLLDASDFLRGLQQASAAAQLFSQRLGVSLQQARRDVEQLNASQLKLAAAARSAPRPGGSSPWAAMFAGPAAAFNSPTGTTSQAALMGFVLRVNNSLAKQAELADQLGEAVERARAALEESPASGEIEDKLKEAAKKVSEAIEKALDKVDEAVDKLKDSFGELADKSEEAADKVDELSEKIKDLGEKSEEADEKVKELGEKAEELGEKSEEAGGKAEEAAEKLEKLAEALKKLLANLPGLPTSPGGRGVPNPGSPGSDPASNVQREAERNADKFMPHGGLTTEPHHLTDQQKRQHAENARRWAEDRAKQQTRGPWRMKLNAAYSKLKNFAWKKRTQLSNTLNIEYSKVLHFVHGVLVKRRVAKARDFYAKRQRLLKKKFSGAPLTQKEQKDLEDSDQKLSEAQKRAVEALPDRAPPKITPMRAANKALYQDIQSQKIHAMKVRQSLHKSIQKNRAAAQDYLPIMRQFALSIQLSEAAMKECDLTLRKQLLEEAELHKKAGEEMKKASDRGVHSIKGLADAAKAAGVDIDKLDKAAEKLAAQGKGQLAPQQQMMMLPGAQFGPGMQMPGMQQPGMQAGQQGVPWGQQVQNWWNNQVQQAQQAWQNLPTTMLNAGLQQAQQFGQQWMQQAGQQAWDSGQAMLEQAIDGPQQVQAMIDQAEATGHKKDAIRLIRQRLEAQLAQSKINLHGLATGLDPNAGSFGSMPGVDNTAYLMTLDIPLVRLIKFLQAQLAALPKMAAGGIVTGPTSIVAGEAGPEAVLPLTNFWNMMGSLPVFQGIQNAVESIGTWFSEGGNNPALAARYFANLDKIQHVYDYSVDRLWNSRAIDFAPASLRSGPAWSGGAAGAIGLEGRAAFGPGGLPFGAGGYAGPMFPVGSMNLHFNGVDITAPGAAVQFAQQLLPALDAEARRTGYSMMGGSMLRAGYGASANRPFAYPR